MILVCVIGLQEGTLLGPAGGDFESGVAEWSVISGQAEGSKEAHAGEQALRLEGTGGRGGLVNSKPFRVRPRARVTLSAFVKQVAGSGAYMVALTWRDGDGKVLRVDNDWWGKDRPEAFVSHGGAFVSPAGTHDAIVSLGVESGSACLIDDVTVRQTGTSPPYRVGIRWVDPDGRVTVGHFGEPLTAGMIAFPRPVDSIGPPNGDFRTGVEGWTSVQSSPDSPPEKRGESRFCRIRSKDRPAGVISGTFTVSPAQLYVVSADARNESDPDFHPIRRLVFAPGDAARAQVELVVRGGDHTAHFDTVRVWPVAAASRPLPPRPHDVWMCPDFRMDPNRLFETGAPWQQARDAIQVYQFHFRLLADADRQGDWSRDWKVNLDRAVLATSENAISLAVETAGLYGSQPGETGLKSAQAELPLLNRITKSGGTIRFLALDGPISRVIKGGRPAGDGGAAGTLNYSLDETIRHLVTYVKTIRASHPKTEIGLITNFPHWDFEGREAYFGKSSYSAGSGISYDQVLDALLKALAAEGERIGFVHADCPFDYFSATRSPYTPHWSGEQERLLALEAYCRKKGVRFGLIYNSEARLAGRDRQFYEETLQLLQRYRAAGGHPDTFIVESWFEFPRALLPDSRLHTFTRLTRDFGGQIRKLYPVR